MKNKLIILYFIGGLALFSSCSDNLELENPNKLTTTSFWKTEADLESGLATVYNVLVDNNNAGYWEIQAMQLKDSWPTPRMTRCGLFTCALSSWKSGRG